MTPEEHRKELKRVLKMLGSCVLGVLMWVGIYQIIF